MKIVRERILADGGLMQYRERQRGLSHTASRLQFVARVQKSQAGAGWIPRVVRCTTMAEVVDSPPRLVLSSSINPFRNSRSRPSSLPRQPLAPPYFVYSASDNAYPARISYIQL
jgi:hypothetical protein